MELTVVQTIRCLAADMVQKANSGHPGAPMGLAPIATLLWGEMMRFDSADPHWQNRDRFVLSNGHGCALLYSMLHMNGFDVSMDDLKNFRQLHSKTPGHPERLLTPNIDVSTGPLGQGISNAVGMAIAEAHLAATFNKDGFPVVDHKTWCIVGDGCLMEGVAQEALSLAGHLGLEKLIVIYDDNKISIDGSTDLAFTEVCKDKYESMGFRVIVVQNGDSDFAAMRAALKTAQEPCGKPTMIQLRTTIGLDSKMQGTAKVHGSPLGAEDIAALKKKYNRDPDQSFVVTDDVYDFFRAANKRGAEARKEWAALLDKYRTEHKDAGAKYDSYWSKKLPEGWESKLPRNGKAIATRKASENALAEILQIAPFVVGGSADLTGSNLTKPGDAKLHDFQRGSKDGRYIRFGVREHAMIAILNGIDAHGGLVPFGGTFLNFVSYGMGAVRLAAMSKHGIVIVATHDSIGLGEDGPTHQPIETMAALRAVPRLITLRPSDQTETSAAWAYAMNHRDRPVCLCLSRQGVDPVESSNFDAVSKGAYAVVAQDAPEVIVVSTGTEVSLAVAAAKQSGLKARVVSMPSFELFDEQPVEYRESIFTPGVPVLSIEPYRAFGWERFSHVHCGIETFGESAPAEKVYEHFGLTAEAISAKIKKLAAHFKPGTAPRLGHLQL